jgi:phage gp36-like protein
MGTYATTTGLQVLMIGVTFDSVTSALATKMITHAENEVDKYLSNRYDTSASPFDTSTTIPPIITSITETLAEGYMHQRMSRGGKDAMARGQTLIEQAIDNLKLISDFKLNITDSSGDIVADMSNTSYRVASTTEGYSNTFNEDDELNWEVDQDKLDDIEDERV